MAPALFLAFALFAADPDEALSTATPAVQPVVTPAQGEPTTEYELVAWCYGALGAHMGLYDVAMPEVERIERRFAASTAEADEDVASYALQRDEGKKQLALFRSAMEAAEKASIRPIQEEGVAAIRKGEAIWTGSQYADPKFLAREWMSWGLPERCSTTAESLQAKSALLGQAISYNTQSETPPTEAPAEPAAETEAEPVADEQPAEPAPTAEPEAAQPEEEATPSEESADALDAIIAGETDDGP